MQKKNTFIRGKMIKESTHLHFIGPDGSLATFAYDNLDMLDNWWKAQCAKLINREHDGFYIVLHKREFTTLIDESTGQPIKRMSSCVFQGERIWPLPREEAKAAYHTDMEGNPIPRYTDLLFVDFTFDE